MSFNKIILVGYLGRAPELRYTPQGTSVCDFSVATSDKRGEQEATTWFKVIAWQRLAENCAEYLTKGAQVYVEGRLRLTEFTDRDGVKRSSLEVTATEIQFLSRTDQATNGNRQPTTGQPSPEQLAFTAQAPATPADSDIPF
jgi:single-strand DNA-binding protein